MDCNAMLRKEKEISQKNIILNNYHIHTSRDLPTLAFFSRILKLVFPGDLFLIWLNNATKSLNVILHMAKNVQFW